jgi:hypothetical protein
MNRKKPKKFSIIMALFMFFMLIPQNIRADSSDFRADVTAPTYGSVNVTIDFPLNSWDSQYSLDDGDTWKDYNGPIKITRNGTINGRYRRIFGDWKNYGSYTVSNITLAPPVDTVNDPNNGNWSLKNVTLKNTSEADMMVRVGNINNFSYGWQAGFNPFSGNPTPTHAYIGWTPPSDTADGTDRIMVNTGYVYGSNNGTDGYTSSSLDSNKRVKDANKVRDITMQYNLSGITVNNAILQMFVDDFQAGSRQPDSNSNFYQFRGNYKATINGLRIPELETTINSLNQSGPIGRMITLNITDSQVLERTIRTGRIAINIDCKDSTAGDGYAIDFVKLLINPVSLDQTSTVTGVVRDFVTRAVLPGVKVVSDGGIVATTDSNGVYTLNKVPAGAPAITASKSGYLDNTLTVYTVAKATSTLNFDMQSTTQPGKPLITENPLAITNQNVQISVEYPDNPSKKLISIKKNSSTEENWVNYTTSVEVGSDWTASTDTWTVKAKSQSASGVWSDVATFTVNNIDKSIPSAPILTANITTPTSGSVIVTAVFPTTGVKPGSQQISVDGGLTYVPYTTEVTLDENATVKAKYINNIGTGTESLIATLNVNNIDRSRPGKPTLSDTRTTLQDGTLAAVVTATFPGNPVVVKISTDNGNTWIDYNGSITLTSNTTILAKSQNSLGIWSDLSDPLVINYIKPGRPVLSQDITTPTNQSVKVSITYPNSAVIKKYKIGDGEWQDYSGDIVVKSNTRVSAICYDSSGIASDEGFINVTNIYISAEIGVIRTNANGSKVVGFKNKSRNSITATSMTSDPSGKGTANIQAQEFTCYANCTVTFVFSDDAGNSGTASIQVNIGSATDIDPDGNIER